MGRSIVRYSTSCRCRTPSSATQRLQGFEQPVAVYEFAEHAMTLRWLDERDDAGVRERGFEVERDGGPVPGVLWTANDAHEPSPLVLIGHGGAGHKRDESRVALGRSYVLDHGCAAAAIDGPWHGDRRRDEQHQRTTRNAIDGMVANWVATLDALAGLAEIDASRVGYGGVSMGTMFGLPLVAAEPRIRAAVLGLCGLTTQAGGPLDAGERLARDAPHISQPLLFLVQWDDELFPREGAFSLFDLLGSREKRLYAHPGKHHETPQHARATTAAFLADQLAHR